MPRIPFSLASGEVPGRIPVDRASPALWAAPGRAIQDVGAEMERTGFVMAKLHRERAESEAISLAQEFDNRLLVTKTEVQRMPDPLSHESIFTERAQEIAEEMRSRSDDPLVQSTLEKHITRRMSGEIADVRKSMLQLFDQKQLAWLAQQKEDLSDKAVMSPTQEGRDDAKNLYLGLIDRYEQRGLLNPLKAEESRQAFTQSIATKQMDYDRRTNRDLMRQREADGFYKDVDPNTRLKILERARTDEQHEQAVQDKNFSIAKEAINNDWSAKANFGQLSDADLDAAKRGKNPFISPTRAKELEKINNAQASNEADTAVAEIAQRYYGGPRTTPRILKFRQEVNALLSTFGKPSAAGSKLLNELQTDEFAVETLDVQRQNNAIRDAKDGLRATPSQTPPIGILKTMDDNERKADEAEAARRIRSGEDKEKVLKSIEDRRKRKYESVPEGDRQLLELGGQ